MSSIKDIIDDIIPYMEKYLRDNYQNKLSDLEVSRLAHEASSAAAKEIFSFGNKGRSIVGFKNRR